MDGFGDCVGVILIVVINWFDILDLVLLWLGCFDCQILVFNFDLVGWWVVLCVYFKGKLMVVGVDFDGLVKWIVGMIGVDLVNVINEVVLLIVWENGIVIIGFVFEEVVDWVIGGLCCKGWIISEQEKKIIVYYEGGYILVVWVMFDIELIYKVMILVCGCIGGYVVVVLEEDKGLWICLEMIV